MSNQVLNISKDRDSHNLQSGNWLKYLTTLTVKKILISKWNFLCSSLCLLPLTLSSWISEKLAPSFVYKVVLDSGTASP